MSTHTFKRGVIAVLAGVAIDRVARGIVVLAVSMACATRAVAGIADSPIPAPFTQLVYSVPGVTSELGLGLATFFECTSTAPTPITVGVEVFPPAGGAPVNNAANSALTVASGATVRFATLASSLFRADSVLAIPGSPPGVPNARVARILSTSKSLICTAFVSGVGSLTATWQLPIIAKTKQKAAN